VLTALSQAWASWKTAPGVALLAIVAFAVGIGSTTAIFTVINGVMLRAVPYPGGERFVTLYGVRTNEPGRFMSFSIPDAQAFQEQTTSFDAFGWFETGQFSLTAPGEPQSVPGAMVTPALARQLGPPLLGQWFTDDNGAVISSSLWQRLGGRRDIVGSAITLEGRGYTVTGVMRPAFEMPIALTAMTDGNTQVWIPLDPSPSDPNPGMGVYFVYARRKPGVSLAQAQADVKRVAVSVAAADPARHQFFTADVSVLRQSKLTNLRPTLLTLLAGAGLLLLIACANVATLLLARSVVRARETAIRVALGASRRQLALRYFAEGALVSIAGAAAGVALSAIFVRYMLAAASEFVPRTDGVTLDWKVLGFSVAAALTTGVLAGLAPLWQALRTPPNAVLTEGVRASASAPARRLARVFVVAEIALAFTLLTSSAVLLVHLRNLGRVTLGFDPDNLVTFDVPMSQRTFATTGRDEQRRLMTALRETSGIANATFANQLPTYPGCLETRILADGQPANAEAQRVCLVSTTVDFLQTMRIPLRAGRFLTTADDDRQDLLPVAINEAGARTIWPNRDAIGGLAQFSGPNGSRLEVIGIVGDVRNDGLNNPPVPEMYVSANAIRANPMTVVIRSDLPIDQVIGAARRAIRQINPTLTMTGVSTLNDTILSTLQLERLSSLMMTFFGLAALLMATLGIYGVMSYFVRQRTVELGTRMALGAVKRDLVTLVMNGGLRLSLTGVAVGSFTLAGSVWLLVQLLEVADVGWLPFAASTAIVGLVSAAAAAVPAWRTTFLSPMAAIREQPPSVWQWARQRMRRTVREIRETVRGHERQSDVSPADLLTAFVDAARNADSYTGALRAVLRTIGDEMQVDAAVLLERRDGARAEYRSIVGIGQLETDPPVIAADGFLLTRLQRYPSPLPFAADELAALAEWAAAHRRDRLDEICALAAANVRLAVPLRTRHEILGVLLLGEGSRRTSFTAHEKQVLRAGADQFALMIENARLTDRVVEQETLRRDIALASDVQRRLLPDAPPHPRVPISPRPACRRDASAATTTISSTCLTADSASRWPMSRARASPRR